MSRNLSPLAALVTVLACSADARDTTPGASDAGIIRHAPSALPEQLVGSEYVIDLPGAGRQPAFYLRIISTTEAVLARPRGFQDTLPIAHVEHASLAVESRAPEVGVSSPPPPPLTGSFLVGTPPILALDAAEDGGIGAEAIYLEKERTMPVCLGQSTWAWVPLSGTVRRDTTPIEVSPNAAEILPWEPFSFSFSKPPVTTPKDTFVATVEGSAVEVEWTSDTLARFKDWAGVVGKTVQFSGVFQGTNGVVAPVSLDAAVVDFGPAHVGGFDFTLGLPNELTTFWTGSGYNTKSSSWSGAEYSPPGAATECGSGCAFLPSETTIALRFSGEGTGLRLRARGSNDDGSSYFEITTARLGGPVGSTQRVTTTTAMTDYEIALPPGEQDALVLVTAPVIVWLTQSDIQACPPRFTANPLYLESVEVVELP